MKKFIETLQNIWKIEELRNRILLTLSLILIYRLGAYVVLPGVDPRGLEALQQQGQDGLIGLINMFSGGAFSNASIFALGIMPYITASIVIQLLGMAVPYFQKLQKLEYRLNAVLTTQVLTIKLVKPFRGLGFMKLLLTRC